MTICPRLASHLCSSVACRALAGDLIFWCPCSRALYHVIPSCITWCPMKSRIMNLFKLFKHIHFRSSWTSRILVSNLSHLDLWTTQRAVKEASKIFYLTKIHTLDQGSIRSSPRKRNGIGSTSKKNMEFWFQVGHLDTLRYWDTPIPKNLGCWGPSLWSWWTFLLEHSLSYRVGGVGGP